MPAPAAPEAPAAPTVEQLTERALELRTAALATADQVREMRERPAEERSDGYRAELNDFTDELLAVDAELRAITSELDQRTADRIREANGRRGPSAALDDLSDDERRSAGQQLVDNEEFRAWLGANHGSGMSPGVEVRALLDSGVGAGESGVWLPQGQPYLPGQALSRRRLFIRDLIASGETTLANIPYIRELDPRVNETGASATLEAGTKAEVVMQFDPADAPARKITAWIAATTEILEDAPTLRSYVDARLAYMVALREEEEILNGNGTAPHLRGLRQTTGVQTQSSVGANEQAATIGMAISKIEDVDGEADGVAINPVTFWTMLTTRHANQFDDGFGGMLPYAGAPRGVWGLPVVRTRALEAGKALVGAYRMGAQLFDRKAITIRVGDQHAEFMTENKLLILAEERVALADYRPDWFVETTLS